MCNFAENLLGLLKNMWRGHKTKYLKLIDDFERENYPATFTYLVFDARTCEKLRETLGCVQKFFDSTHNWVLLGDNATFASFEVAARNLEIGVDTEVILAVFEGETAVLHQPYKIKEQDFDLGV